VFSTWSGKPISPNNVLRRWIVRCGVRRHAREADGHAGNVRIPLQVDVGAGDAVVPPPVVLDYPGLLDLPRARLRAYRPETSIAEKTEAMVRLALANSRMKDFFDISTGWPRPRPSTARR
jgi:Nucleotidyl transferase AbiEii toxin, Type IV TA system